MNNPYINLVLPLAGLASAFACSVDDRKFTAGGEFSRNLEYGVQATPQVTPLPPGVGTGPQVIALPTSTDAPTVMAPGDRVNFAIAWEGGPITEVNMAFAVDQYFSIPVPQAGADASGVAQIPATVGLGVCDALGDMCHQIECFEQVVTADGTVSLAEARQIVLDCGGLGCGARGMGTAQPGDPCDGTQACVPGSICFNRFCVGAGVLRISLGFNVDSDFDLHVLTPAGSEIYFGLRTADAGTLDVDQCISACGTDPHAENVVFSQGALPGTYEVWVDNFDGRAGGPFTIEVAGDVSHSFRGELPAGYGESMHFTFTL